MAPIQDSFAPVAGKRSLWAGKASMAEEALIARGFAEIDVPG